MQKYLSEINYDKLIEKSLKNVVIEALKIAEAQGLPGEHHFYITFKTNHPETSVSNQFKNQYPEDMTIVLQHQYTNLTIGENGFAVDLSFGGILQTLSISYDSITYFADPHSKFGLSFNIGEELFTNNLHDDDFNTETETKKASNGGATVVSIDSYRRK